MKVIKKKDSYIFLVSVIFIIIGIIFNPYFIAYMFTADGSIDDKFLIFLIYIFDFISFIIGFLIFKYKKYLFLNNFIILKKIIFIICYIIFLLFFIEVLAYYFYEFTTPLPGRCAVEFFLGNNNEKLTGQRIISHPYMLYQNTPNWTDGENQIINSLGYRNKNFSIKKKSGTVRILVMGGSTTYCYPYIKKNRNTWISILERHINKKSNKRVQIINAGLPYATSAELLAGFVFRYRFLNPDIIIIHTGGNDIAPLLFENYNPEYTHFRRSAGNAVRYGEKSLLKSNIMKIIYAWWFSFMGGLPSYIGQPKPFTELDSQLALKRVNTIYPEGFERNLDLIVNIASSKGIKLILFGFLSAPKDIIIKKDIHLKHLVDAIKIGLRKNYEIMEKIQLKYKQNVIFIKPDPNLFNNEYFIDNCHLNEDGEKVKAKILLKPLLNLIKKLNNNNDRNKALPK